MIIGNIELSFPKAGRTRAEVVNDAGEKIREILRKDYGRKDNWPRLSMTGFYQDDMEIRVSYDLIPEERVEEE